MANNKFRSGRERDPIAELAQLIAEADPYAESAAPDNRFRQETSSEGHDAAPVLPAPLLPADVRAPEHAHELDERLFDDEAYDANNPPYASHEEYQTEIPHVRRRGLALMIAMTGLALLTAGTFGYREMFGGSVIATPPPIITASNEPNKIAPVSGEPPAKNSGNARQDGADTTGSIEKLVSREEQQLSRQNGHRPAWAHRPRLRRLLSVSRYRTKWIRPRILQGLFQMPLRRSVLANRLQQMAQLKRTAPIWLPSPSQLPKRIERQQLPLLL
jgi:hypothetical protein